MENREISITITTLFLFPDLNPTITEVANQKNAHMNHHCKRYGNQWLEDVLHICFFLCSSDILFTCKADVC